MVFVLLVVLCGLVSSINVEIVAQEALEENVATTGKRNAVWDVGAYIETQYAGNPGRNIDPRTALEQLQDRAYQLRRDLAASEFQITVTLDPTPGDELEEAAKDHVKRRWTAQSLAAVLRSQDVDNHQGVLRASLGPGPDGEEGRTKIFAFLQLIEKCVEAALPADLTKFMGGIMAHRSRADVPKLVTAVIAHFACQDFVGLDVVGTLGLPISAAQYNKKYPKFGADGISWAPVGTPQWSVTASIDVGQKRFFVQGSTRQRLTGNKLSGQTKTKTYFIQWSYDFRTKFATLTSVTE